MANPAAKRRIQGVQALRLFVLLAGFVYIVFPTPASAADPLLPIARTITSLAPGISSAATTAQTIPITISAGNYYVCVQADEKGAVFESNEGNNTGVRQTPLR